MCGTERLSNEALPVQAMVLLHPKEVPLCLTGTVSKICWRFYTGTLRRRLTRSHAIVGALSMAICRWDSKSTVWATGVSSLLWWKVLEERRKFSMSTTTNTRTPRCVLCCPRWAVIEHFIGSALFSNPEIQVQVCSPGRPAEPRRRRGGRDRERGRRGHRAAA